MNETILTLLAHHGAVILFALTLSASLAIPVPASFGLLAAGAFAASGDLSAPVAALAALAGAVLGDVSGYGVGRWGGSPLWDRMVKRPKISRMLTQARDQLHAHANRSVLLSRWPFSPLGPYVNLVSGATHLPPGGFVLFCLIGDAVWIALYVGLGYMFASRVKDIGEVLSFFVGALAAGFVTVLLVRMIRSGRSAA